MGEAAHTFSSGSPPGSKWALAGLEGEFWLVCSLLYGTGMRLMEGLRLRVKDVDFARSEILIRDGKGIKDRVMVLPRSLLQPLQRHLAVV
ncbi:site-specific tyrosine recombinase XerC [compost metagenome]